MKLSVICALVFVAYASADTAYDKGPRCYDCNYAPSGYVLSKGASYSAKVGYHSCALRTAYDKKNVDKWGCKSGMCFIRKDYNGLVYRGCANQENLPWAVDSNVNCQYQGASKSLYYFCKGDLCNERMLGESPELCGAPALPLVDASQVNAGVDARQFGKSGSAGQNEYEVQEQAGYAGQGEQQGYAQENQVQQENAYESISLGKDVCNGDCSYNPSGLFPYDNEGRYFIQCESDVRSYGTKGSHPCTCCKPTVLPCPYGARFSDADKVCSFPY